MKYISSLVIIERVLGNILRMSSRCRDFIQRLCENMPARNVAQSDVIGEARVVHPADLISEIAAIVHNRIYASAKSHRSPSHPIQLAIAADLICSTLITTFVPATPR